MPAHTVVLGMGNPILTDDSVGVRLARGVRHRRELGEVLAGDAEGDTGGVEAGADPGYPPGADVGARGTP